MDIVKLAGSSIFILIVSALVIFIRIRNRKRNSRKIAVLQAFAVENQSTISTWDTWENTLIGISTPETNRLFFIRSIPGREIRQVINLSEVADCRMVKTGKQVAYHKELVQVVDKIELVFSLFQHQPALSLEFYNADYNNLTLSGELQLAQKWAGIVNSISSSNRKHRIIPMRKAKGKRETDGPATFSTRRAG